MLVSGDSFVYLEGSKLVSAFILAVSCFVGSPPIAVACLLVWTSLSVGVALGSKDQLLLLFMNGGGQAE